MECLLFDAAIAERVLPELGQRYAEAGVEVRACERALQGQRTASFCPRLLLDPPLSLSRQSVQTPSGRLVFAFTLVPGESSSELMSSSSFTDALPFVQ